MVARVNSKAQVGHIITSERIGALSKKFVRRMISSNCLRRKIASRTRCNRHSNPVGHRSPRLDATDRLSRRNNRSRRNPQVLPGRRRRRLNPTRNWKQRLNGRRRPPRNLCRRPKVRPQLPRPRRRRLEPAESNTQFVPDDAEIDRDEFGRGVLAVALARRLHRIWCALNGAMPTNPDPPPSPSAAKAPIDSVTWTGNADESCFFDRQRDTTRAAFVVHLDAPWGGGKRHSPTFWREC